MVSMASENEYEMNKVKERIVDRAEGVFLWVSLAVKDQIRGLRNDDSPEQLQERLSRLPNEAEGIYIRMLDRIDRIYVREASMFLKMALNHRILSVLELAIAFYPGLEDMLLSADEISEQKIVSLCRSIRNKLATRCVGFLEVHEPSGQDMKRQTTSDRTHDSGKQLEASSEVDMSASEFQRETGDYFDLEKEPGQSFPKPDNRVPASSSKPEITDVEILEFESDTSINFIHRTAVDFLENPGPGKAFLDTEPSPAFHHRVQSIKAQLGSLRLREEIGFRRATSWSGFRGYDIDTIMDGVAYLEELTGMPQVKLCELVDGTMSNLDLRHPDWSPDSHWCTRWGQLVKMETLGLEGTFSTTSSTTNLDKSGATQTDPKTFLSFAASYGLSLYVNHVLDCRRRNAGSKDLDGLLCCSIFGDSHIPLNFESRPLTIVPKLLSRGANPNARVIGKTIWECFLDRMAETWEQRVFSERFDSSRARETLALAAIAFIEHGADCGMIWSGTIIIWLGRSSSMPYQRCSFDLQASALSIIELIMRNEPVMARISEMCATRGAVRYSRCNSISFVLKQEGEELRNQFKLSEQESKEILEILELWTPDDKDNAILMRHLSEFYTRLVENRAGASE